MRIQTPEVKQIALAAFPGYNGRKFSVEPFRGTINLASCWDGGSKSDFVFMSLETGKQFVVAENGSPWSNGGQILQCSELPANVVLVEHRVFCGGEVGITIFVRPDNMAKMITEGTGPEVSRNELIVLAATCSTRNTYGGETNLRFKEANRICGTTQEDWDAARALCVQNGLLLKSGAFTDAGRNAIEGKRDLYNYRQTQELATV